MVSMFSLSLKAAAAERSGQTRCDSALGDAPDWLERLPLSGFWLDGGWRRRGERGNGEKEEEVAAAPARVLRTLDGFVP